MYSGREVCCFLKKVTYKKQENMSQPAQMFNVMWLYQIQDILSKIPWTDFMQNAVF